MKFHINIELDIPRWVRNAALVLVPVAIVLATTAIVRANVPNAFKDGDTLSAMKMNDNFDALDARLTATEGSIASGANYATGTATQFDTSSLTFVDIPGLAATITTQGRPVTVAVSTNFNPTAGSFPSYGPWCVVTVIRDGVNLGHATYGFQVTGAALQDNVPVTFTFLDVPPAGAHTYKVQVRAGEAGVAMIMGEANQTQQLSVYEIR